MVCERIAAITASPLGGDKSRAGGSSDKGHLEDDAGDGPSDLVERDPKRSRLRDRVAVAQTKVASFRSSLGGRGQADEPASAPPTASAGARSFGLHHQGGA